MSGRETLRKRNLRILAVAGSVVAGMVGLTYASVPLYRLFCQVTGFGGTPRVATVAPSESHERMITVRFDSNVAPGLPWSFQPAQGPVQVPLGEERLVHYRARNTADHEVVGTATFNVTPLKAGKYFNKIECFCFTEQRLAPGEAIEMPVSFFVDPELARDRNLDDVTQITLSYTFFPAKDERRPAPGATAQGDPRGAMN